MRGGGGGGGAASVTALNGCLYAVGGYDSGEGGRGGGEGGGGGAASVTALNGCLYAVGGYDSGEGGGGRSCLCHRPQRLSLRRGGIRLW